MRPREGGDFGERVVRDLLNTDGAWCIDGPPRGPWDLEYFPARPFLPVFVEVKSALPGREFGGLSREELVFRERAMERKLGWAEVHVRYARNGAKVAGKPRYRVVAVELFDVMIAGPEVRNALSVSLARTWRPARPRA